MKFSSFVMLAIAITATASAQIIPIEFDPGDTTSFDGWTGLNAVNYPGYGTFPGLSSWPGPIGANVAGSGDADLVKIANNPGEGGPFIATGSLYFGSFTAIPNTFGGTVAVEDASPLGGVNTIVFQIQIGEAQGYDFFNDEPPVLFLNGTTPVTLTFSSLIDRFQSGTFVNPITDEDEPIYVNTWGFQWDVSEFGDPITSLSIEINAVTHSQIYALQLNQSSGIYDASLIPEPSSGILLALGLLGILTVLNRRFRIDARLNF